MKKIALALIITTVFLTACSANRWIRKTVVDQHKFSVILEQQAIDNQIMRQQYAHPFQMDPEDLETIMSQLAYTEKVGLLGKEQETPIFQAIELERLVPVLIDTLSKADDSQRIRFSSFNQSKTLIFSVSRETEGVLFIAPDGHLNIAFSFINSEMDPTQTTSYPSNFSRMDPLKIKYSDTPIAPPAYAVLHAFENKKSAPMWIIADLKKLKAADKNASRDKSLLKEAIPSDIAPPSPGTLPVTKTEAEAKSIASEKTIQQEIKHKLEYLKELLDDGLITENDYNSKKKELLDRLK